MRMHLFRATGLGMFIVLLTAAGGYTFSQQVHAQPAPPAVEEVELAVEAAGAWLGILIAPFTERAATRLNIPYRPGVLAARVVKDGPAQKAGVQDRDVITAVDGHAVDNPAALRAEIAKRQAGDTVTLSLVRAGADVSAAVRLEAAPQRQPRPDKARGDRGPTPGMAPFMPGMMPRNFDNAIGGTFTYKDENGQQETIRATFGKVASATDAEVTITPNGGGAAVKFQITGNTRMRGKGSDLKADDKVVAITRDGAAELRGLMVVRQMERHKQGGRGGSQGSESKGGRVQGLPAMDLIPRLEILERMPIAREITQSRIHDVLDRLATEWSH